MASARAARFALRAPPRPRELLRPVQYDVMPEELREAMRAALRGDFGALDRIELRYLNVLVRIGELKVVLPEGSLHDWFVGGSAIGGRMQAYGNVAPFVVGLHRGFGPAGRSALEWWLAEKCRRCDGKLAHTPECRVCGGSWYVADASDWVLYTDPDGVLIQGHG